METNLPYGGKEIASLRLNRKRPADMILVSLVGPLRENNPLVIAKPERSYNWKFISGLEVLIVASTSIDKSLVKLVIDAIAAFYPDYLGVWFSDKQNGAHIAWGSFRAKSQAMRWMSPRDREMFKGLGHANN